MSECLVSKVNVQHINIMLLFCFSGAVDRCLGSVLRWRLWYQMRWTAQSSLRRYRWGPTWRREKSARSLPTRCGSRIPRTTASISLLMEKVHITYRQQKKTFKFNLYFEYDKHTKFNFSEHLLTTNYYYCYKHLLMLIRGKGKPWDLKKSSF